jgi:hypothetical protein
MGFVRAKKSSVFNALLRLLHAVWTEPFRVDDFVFRPVEYGTETSGMPEDVFKHGDWVTLGYIEPARPMDWDKFLNELFFVQWDILEKAFDIMKSKLERLGYEIEISPRPLFYVEPGDKPRIWYIVKKRGRPIAYCDLVVSVGEGEEPYAELSTVCMKVPKKSK